MLLTRSDACKILDAIESVDESKLPDDSYEVMYYIYELIKRRLISSLTNNSSDNNENSFDFDEEFEEFDDDSDVNAETDDDEDDTDNDDYSAPVKQTSGKQSSKKKSVPNIVLSNQSNERKIITQDQYEQLKSTKSNTGYKSKQS